MFKNIHEKINNTIIQLVIIGLIFIVLAIMVIGNAYTLQFLVGVTFFLLAYFFLHFAYKIQHLKNNFEEKFGWIDGHCETKKKKSSR